MQELTPLRRSIIRHGVLAFLAPGIVLLVVFTAYRLAWGRWGACMGISAAYHGLLTLFLFLRSGDFRVEGSREPLTRVNLATTLTFVRLSSLPTVVFLVIEVLYAAAPVSGSSVPVGVVSCWPPVRARHAAGAVRAVLARPRAGECLRG